MSIVTHQHLRSLGYCNRGLRRWFAEQGIEWSEFLENGIDSQYLRASGNAMAIAASDLADAQREGRSKEDVKRGGCV